MLTQREGSSCTKVHTLVHLAFIEQACRPVNPPYPIVHKIGRASCRRLEFRRVLFRSKRYNLYVLLCLQLYLRFEWFHYFSTTIHIHPVWLQYADSERR